MKKCNSLLKIVIMVTAIVIIMRIPAFSQFDTLKVNLEVIDSLRNLGHPVFYSKFFGLGHLSIVNMIPQDRSNETFQDSEPNLAVDPSNRNHIVGSAFTMNYTGATNLAPVFISTDGGNTWDVNNIVPSGNGMTGDISIDFAREDNTLYAGILRGGSGLRQMVLRTDDPFTGGTMTTLTDHSTEDLDQPYVSATTFDDGGTNRDRVFVGFNEYDNRTGAGGTGRTASVEHSPDARTAAPPAGFSADRIEQRNTFAQDMPAIRCAVHNDGVVYAVFYRWTSGNVPSAVCDVVVARDDNFATGASPFSDLTDPSDGVAGRLVATGRTVPAFPAFLGDNRLVASNLSIAVHPGNSGIVYIAWADRVGTNDYTLHVRRSTNSGASWSNDLLTVTNATNPALAISTRGVVGFLYQQLTGTAPNQRWETHMRRSSDGNSWTDLVLANTPDGNPPVSGFQPYIGDYCDLIAVGRTFYGIFSASNIPDLANFPNGVRYQRNANFTTKQLRNVNDNANVSASIDPFFFRISPPTVFDICEVHPWICEGVQLEFGYLLIDVVKFPVRIKDPIDKNCLVKWECPGCEGADVLCPPYYHMFFEDIDPRSWEFTIFDRLGEPVKQHIYPLDNGIVVSFRPSKKMFDKRNIGDYYLGIESVGKIELGEYKIKTKLEVSDFPITEHIKRMK